MTIRSAVLAGGASSRFGGKPKGLERVGGERILDRVVHSIQDAVGTLPVLIANAPEAVGWRHDLTVTPDVLPNRGSLGGIYTAVASGDGPVLVLAWDMPFVPSSLLRELVACARDYDVFLPATDDPDEIEPLCGIYGPACVPVIRQHLEDEDFRATGFHEEVRTGFLPLEEVTKHGDPATLFFNVNTVDDLAKAKKLWRVLNV